MKKGNSSIFATLGMVVILATIAAAYYLVTNKTQLQVPAKTKQTPVIIPTPPEFVFKTYMAPKIEKKSTYTIFMIGDSMTRALGPHGGTFYKFINDLYIKDNIGILIDNYAQG